MNEGEKARENALERDAGDTNTHTRENGGGKADKK
jgi:hypothetical protein